MVPLVLDMAEVVTVVTSLIGIQPDVHGLARHLVEVRVLLCDQNATQGGALSRLSKSKRNMKCFIKNEY